MKKRSLNFAFFLLLSGFTAHSSIAAAAEEKLVLAGGCFWGMEAVFEHVKGVTNVVSGYAGGEAGTAHYDQVSAGKTAHAEAVQITYDPELIKPQQILQVYFISAHDPTQLNYQGPDRGTQYRSAIFYANPEQKKEAQDAIAKLGKDKKFPNPIVTTLEPLKQFYAAEDDHQNFAARNPYHPYILMHDAPKIKALKKDFPDIYVEKKS